MERSACIDWQLIHVPANQLPDWWPWIREGLLVVKKKTKERWYPEDLYAAIRGGASLLFVGCCNKYPVGFAVVTPQGEELHIWAAHLTAPAFDLALRDLERIGKNMGASRLVFGSPRKGWAKRGFRAIKTLYEKEIP